MGRPRAKVLTRISRNTYQNMAGRGSSSSTRQPTLTSTPDPSAARAAPPTTLPCGRASWTYSNLCLMGTWIQKDADSRSEDTRRWSWTTPWGYHASGNPASSPCPRKYTWPSSGCKVLACPSTRTRRQSIQQGGRRPGHGGSRGTSATGRRPIPGVDVGPNPRVQERTGRWQLKGKQRDVNPFTVSGARQLLQARSWPGNASGKQIIINPTRWTPPEWPVTRPMLSGRMWAMIRRKHVEQQYSSWEKTVLWRLAHGAFSLNPMGRARQGCLCCQGGWVETAHLLQCPATAGARYWIHHRLTSWHRCIIPPITVLHWLGSSIPRETSKMPNPNIALWHSIRVLFVTSIWAVYGKTLAHHRQQTPGAQADDPARHAAGDVLAHFHTKLRLEMKMQWRRAWQPILVTKRRGTATRVATGKAVFWLVWGRNGVFLQVQPTGEDATPTLRLT